MYALLCISQWWVSSVHITSLYYYSSLTQESLFGDYLGMVCTMLPQLLHIDQVDNRIPQSKLHIMYTVYINNANCWTWEHFYDKHMHNTASNCHSDIQINILFIQIVYCILFTSIVQEWQTVEWIWSNYAFFQILVAHPNNSCWTNPRR